MDKSTKHLPRESLGDSYNSELVYITLGLTYGGPVALLRFVRLCLFLFRVFVDFTGHLALFSKDEA